MRDTKLLTLPLLIALAALTAREAMIKMKPASVDLDQGTQKNVTLDANDEAGMVHASNWFIEYATASEERYNEEIGRFEEVFYKMVRYDCGEWEQLSMWTEEEIRGIPSFLLDGVY